MRRADSQAFDAVATVALLVCAAGVVLVFARKEVTDDAFISYRHAWNLVHGRGLSWNAAPRVEGDSDLLWTLLSAIPIWFGVTVWKVMIALGVACAVAAGFVASLGARRCGVRPLIGHLAAAAVAVCPAYWVSSLNGLEGSLFGLTLVAAVVLICERRRPVLAGLVVGAAFLTRLEGGVLLPLGILTFLGAERGVRRGATRSFATTAGLVVLGTTLFRLVYYGNLVPNSVRAKSVSLTAPGDLFANIADGRSYVWQAAGAASVAFVLLVIAGVFASRRVEVRVTLAVVATGVSLALLNRGDWMANYRLLMPYVPVSAFAGAVGLERFVRASTRSPDGGRRILGIGMAVLVACVAWTITSYGWVGPSSEIVLPAGGVAAVVQGLAPTLEANNLSVAPEAMGRAGWVAPRVRVEDMFGLADEYIAKHGEPANPYGKVEWNYFVTVLQPDVIIFHTGLYHLAQIEYACHCQVEDTYDVYELGIPAPSSPSVFFAVLVKHEAVAAVMPALLAFQPTLVPR